MQMLFYVSQDLTSTPGMDQEHSVTSIKGCWKCSNQLESLSAPVLFFPRSFALQLLPTSCVVPEAPPPPSPVKQQASQLQLNQTITTCWAFCTESWASSWKRNRAALVCWALCSEIETNATAQLGELKVRRLQVTGYRFPPSAADLKESRMLVSEISSITTLDLVWWSAVCFSAGLLGVEMFTAEDGVKADVFLCSVDVAPLTISACNCI